MRNQNHTDYMYDRGDSEDIDDEEMMHQMDFENCSDDSDEIIDRESADFDDDDDLSAEYNNYLKYRILKDKSKNPHNLTIS